MDYERFLEIVQRQAGVPRPAAELATRATLETLAERLPKGEAHELAAQLPDEVIPLLFTDHPGQAFDGDEFVRRVAQREGTDVAIAEWHVRGVFAALRHAVSPDEISDLLAALPHALHPLLTGTWIPPVDEFVARVAEHAGTEVTRAAVDAVLEVLAERLPPGEVDDLVQRLPIELHATLLRGKPHGDVATTKMTAEAFLARIAERTGVDLATARRYVRGVLGALRDLAPEEYADVTATLPTEYTALLPPPLPVTGRGRRE